MDKMKMETANKTLDNLAKLKEMFPEVITETKDENGEIVAAVDAKKLEQLLSTKVIEGDECYDFTWVGKKRATVETYMPIRKTLRPCREESVDWENTKNVICVGDNLDVLKLLQESYLNKIDMIYMDPPYNTGTNMIYTNDYTDDETEYLEASNQISDGYKLVTNPISFGRHHSRWLSIMYSRLKLARNLLSEKGFCVLAIDNSEIENLIKVCDEVFGESNRVGIVTVVHKPEGRNQEKFFGTSNEYALFYAKNKAVTDFQNVILDTELEKKYSLIDDKGKYRLQNFIRLTDGTLAYRDKRPKFWYPLYVNIKTKKIYTELPNNEENIRAVYPITKNGIEMSWKLLPTSAQLLIDENALVVNIDSDNFITIEEKIRATQVIKTHWIRKEYNAIQYGTKIANEVLGANIFDFPKSLYLMEDIIKLTTSQDSLVLDLFGGSGTTAHAIMDLNNNTGSHRKYILIQLDEPTKSDSEAYKKGYTSIDKITISRIKNAVNYIHGDKMEHDSDFGFRVFKIDSTNMKDIYYAPDEWNQDKLLDKIDNIKQDRTSEDLLYACMLEWGLELSLPHKVQKIDGFNVHIVNDGDLVACFDNKISEEAIKQIADLHPLRAVFRDSSFANDAARINISEIFKLKSPNTTIKVL